jgi:hypothetical protein
VTDFLSIRADKSDAEMTGLVNTFAVAATVKVAPRSNSVVRNAEEKSFIRHPKIKLEWANLNGSP